MGAAVGYSLKRKSTFAALALAVATSGSALADTPFQKLMTFLNKPESQGPYFMQILNPIPTEVFKICPDAKIVNMQINMFQPVTFNAAGQPISGQWVEHIVIKSCGKAKLFNIQMQAEADGRPHGKVMVPGNTKADLALQSDAMKSAMMASRKLVSASCPNEMVTDTLFVGAEGVATKGAKAPPYKELWAVDACGKKVQVTLHFVPDAKGIEIFVKPEESRVMGK